MKNWSRLFIISFVTLFLEMLIIRWLPSEIYVLGYYKNAILIAAFLGLGLGMLTKVEYFQIRMLAPLLTLMIISVFFISKWVEIDFTNTVEYIWGAESSAKEFSLDIHIILAFFLLMVLVVFLPLGKILAQYIKKFTPLVGYSINIFGSIIGVLVFSILSYMHTSPVVWFLIAGLSILPLTRKIQTRGILVVCFAVIMVFLVKQNSENVFWSPYSKIQITPFEMPGTENEAGLSLGYGLTVNGAGHQSGLNLSKKILSDPKLQKFQQIAVNMHSQAISYRMVYDYNKKHDDILIVGSGMGNDIACAIRENAKQIDAVEIDPLIVEIGKRFHPEKPYSHPNVTVFNTDARSYFERCRKKYDIIVFSSLDSLSYLTGMSNIRLDNFVYTTEGLSQAQKLLKEDGVLVLMFSVRKPWIGQRLYQILDNAFDAELLSYELIPFPKAQIIAMNQHIDAPPAVPIVFKKADYQESVVPSTDDWPFLYMERPEISQAYIIFIILLLFVSLLSTKVLVPNFRKINPTFFLLGSGFLLLETKSITSFSLLFGTTWWVISLAFMGVLVMILIGNYLVSRFPGILTTRLAFIAIGLTILLNYLLPSDIFLGLSFVSRGFFSTLLVTCPLAFAAVVFAKAFRQVKDPDNALGSNILGAVIGGLLEYACLLLGMKALYIIALLIYGCAFLTNKTE